MANEQKPGEISGMIILLLVLSSAIIIRKAFTGNEQWLWGLVVTLPLLLLVGIINLRKKKKPKALRKPPVERRFRHSFDTDQDSQPVRRREEPGYIRFKVFSKGR